MIFAPRFAPQLDPLKLWVRFFGLFNDWLVAQNLRLQIFVLPPETSVVTSPLWQAIPLKKFTAEIFFAGPPLRLIGPFLGLF